MRRAEPVRQTELVVARSAAAVRRIRRCSPPVWAATMTLDRAASGLRAGRGGGGGACPCHIVGAEDVHVCSSGGWVGKDPSILRRKRSGNRATSARTSSPTGPHHD